jgi:hypothetical protein
MVREDAADEAENTGPTGCEGIGSCIREGSSVNPPRESYETGCDRESTMTNAGSQHAEIWLRGNIRPVAWLALVTAAVAGGLIAIVGMGAKGPLAWLLASAVCAIAAGVVGTLAYAAARPRLERRGDFLQIRLSPTAAQGVPLDAVECFFQGSNPIARSGEPTCGDRAAFRVNTLVMRLAERAGDVASRPTFTPWGTWEDGYVVFDGRWCEPLSADLARSLSRQLVDAKRALAERRTAGVGS